MSNRKALKIAKIEEIVITLIKEKCESDNVSNSALSRITGIPNQTISSTFTGKRTTSLGELEKICKALNLVLSKVVNQAELLIDSPASSLPPIRTLPTPSSRPAHPLDGLTDQEVIELAKGLPYAAKELTPEQKARLADEANTGYEPDPDWDTLYPEP